MVNANLPWMACDESTLVMYSTYWSPDPLGDVGTIVTFTIQQPLDPPAVDGILEFAFLDATNETTSTVTYNLPPNTSNFTFNIPMLVPQFLPSQYIVQVRVLETSKQLCDPLVLCCIRFPHL
ncbi:hypothetical protein F8M41_016744 [Gigaspora margarita]|uniref:Uncharacterized protein n=1 Tax=Gigaspora margarita TaxID=4874 RepID=A0A8H4B2Z9_GIGMA|nr:hypothetical protein F8M41_016744 [Gigaspora margarita]